MISSDQVRAARAILRLAQAELAKAAGVSLETIKRVEAMEGELKIRLDTLTKIKSALEKAGVEFIAENGGGAGVRLAKKAKRNKLEAAQAAGVSEIASDEIMRMEIKP
jgi:transcriptional regulator with XRE-family HTH domain